MITSLSCQRAGATPCPISGNLLSVPGTRDRKGGERGDVIAGRGKEEEEGEKGRKREVGKGEGEKGRLWRGEGRQGRDKGRGRRKEGRRKEGRKKERKKKNYY